jgi:MoaA/NifB/PqqE/SkfB family radical SAM enzyme
MTLRQKLRGIRRVYLSGGEPLLRQDIFDLLRAYHDDFEVVGLPTSCTTIDRSVAKRLGGLVHYINTGLDGPRATNDLVRGNYDGILRGILNLRDAGLEVSLSTVVLTRTLPYMPYVVQVADTLGATKVKMAFPVLRGRAKTLPESEITTKDETVRMFEKLVQLKKELGWRPSIKLALWDQNTEGYALLVYPNQQVYAWPVYGAPDGVMHVGDLSKQDLEQIWQAYPFKRNHINKYVGRTTYNG